MNLKEGVMVLMEHGKVEARRGEESGCEARE
jgi:hypothetical protein